MPTTLKSPFALGVYVGNPNTSITAAEAGFPSGFGCFTQAIWVGALQHIYTLLNQWLSATLKAAQTACEPIQFVNIWDSNGGRNYTFTGNRATKPLEAAASSRYFVVQSNGTLKVVVPAITGYVGTIDTTPPTILAVSSNVTRVSY